MKFSQSSRGAKGNTAFYIVIALCLILIGVASWFAFSKTTDTSKQNINSEKSKLKSSVREYTDDIESYTDNGNTSSNSLKNSDPASKKVTDEKYVSKKNTITTKEKSYTMPVNGEILKDYNTKTLQYSATYNDMRIHSGVDIACTEGTLVSAVSDGKITAVENTADFGKTVTIDHGDGLIIKYCGLKNITVQKDTAIKMGDSIGAVGTVPCECSDQSHLHLEAFEKGKSISPLKFFD